MRNARSRRPRASPRRHADSDAAGSAAVASGRGDRADRRARRPTPPTARPAPPAAPRRARARRSSRGGGWSTRSGRSRSCRPTRSRRSIARRCGSWPRSASRSSATGRSTRSPAPGATVDRSTRRVRLDPGPGRGARSRPRPPTFDAPRPQPGAEHRLRRAEPRLRRGRRPGLRQRPRPRPARRQLRRLRRLRPAHRRARRHPPGGRRPARAERPAGRDPPPRHVPDLRGRARQDLAVPRASARDRSTTRSRSPASSAASTATTLAPRAVADDRHQHQLAAPPRRADGRRADRDGAPRPAGRRHAVHAGRRDEPGLAGRRARPAERRGAVPRRAVADRPAGRADGLRRVHLERRHADRRAGVRDARSRSRAQLASGQLARRYGLPWRSSNATASNVVDAQAAYESEMAVWGAVMGGVNLLYQGAGWLEGGLTASYEKLIIDAEILQMMSEVLQPLVVDEATPRLRRDRRRRPGRPLLRHGPHPRALRDRVLPAARVGLAQLRDVAGGRGADRDPARQRDLEAAPRRGRAAAARPARSSRRSTPSSRAASARSPPVADAPTCPGFGACETGRCEAYHASPEHPISSCTATARVVAPRGTGATPSATGLVHGFGGRGNVGWGDASVGRSSVGGDDGGERSRWHEGLRAAYARERLEEVIRAVAEDALSPSQSDILPWHDESLLRGGPAGRGPRRHRGDRPSCSQSG